VVTSLVLFGSIIGFFTKYEHIVSLEGALSHNLILGFMGIALSLFLTLYLLVKPASFATPCPGAEELSRAVAVVGSSTSSLASLAFLGDKALLFSESGRSFVMYGVRGRSWVSMGDPVGDPGEVNELIWKFREICDQQDGVPVFYEVDRRYLDQYIELGLGFLKIGEEGKVGLGTFSTAGKENQGLRYTMNKLSREGCQFEVVPRGSVGPLIPELSRVSDSWLREKKAAEKAFSLGRFEPSYLDRFDIAVVRKDGVVIAFANLWTSGGKAELRVDLMRYAPDSPHGLMDFLFVSLMEYGKASGFGHFNLGIAPLSGFEYHPLASRWDKICHYIYNYVENIYGFKGLRKYKEKFRPVWSPVYIALPVTILAPWHIFKIALLASSGLRGIFLK
ncbi:MAG: phosphatidylglycerol lysyltransferase domain-containing protein, partial [Rectinemataceae bacterium]